MYFKIARVVNSEEMVKVIAHYLPSTQHLLAPASTPRDAAQWGTHFEPTDAEI